MSDEAQIYPPDVGSAARVIQRWLHGRLVSQRLRKLSMTISDLGEVDIHPETLEEAYKRGLDDGIHASPSDTHVSPERLAEIL